ncbi:LacI family DNA-binding transcriptional regulator [Acidisoma cellulosilytica]|uniref:LacI family DNA-binding transcriptional regulator n=1 Tax=Acidisoma cellulosilyticum TaxID=2802395 RepID=A0A964E3U5_9PROT|nr:LacI family DNA-binding transcriptional regulator [Acidisoma cellulosilyticum]MCB8881010.1 LacI family DNA-binding transcriptional regulator [Acidisoma cellulosilyticum]
MPKTPARMAAKSVPPSTITLKHVAERAGVSPITVSRVINTPDAVSETLRDKVTEAIDALGYVPNRVAGALASAKSRVVPIIVPSLSNIVFLEVIQGAQDVLNAAGYQLLLGDTQFDLEREQALANTLLGWSPAGMIIAGLRHTDRTRAMLKTWHRPVVEVMEYGTKPIDMNVGLSHYKAGDSMGEHLVARGYRNIAFIGCRMKVDYRAMQRFKGLERCLKRHDLPCRPPFSHDEMSSAELGGDALMRALDLDKSLDAIFFANDDLAIGAILRAQREGIAVPKRIAIAGFNGLNLGALMQPALTTIVSPRQRIGQIAATKLLARILGQQSGAATVDVGFSLRAGGST